MNVSVVKYREIFQVYNNMEYLEMLLIVLASILPVVPTQHKLVMFLLQHQSNIHP